MRVNKKKEHILDAAEALMCVSVKYPTPSKKQKAGLRSVRLKQKITKRNE